MPPPPVLFLQIPRRLPPLPQLLYQVRDAPEIAEKEHLMRYFQLDLAC